MLLVIGILVPIEQFEQLSMDHSNMISKKCRLVTIHVIEAPLHIAKLVSRVKNHTKVNKLVDVFNFADLWGDDLTNLTAFLIEEIESSFCFKPSPTTRFRI